MPTFQPEEEELFRRHCAALPSQQARLLLQRVALQNLEVRAAWARVRRAQAQAEQRAAARLPSIQLSVQGNRSKTNPPRLGPIASPETFIIEQYEASVAAEYELDLWNRLSNVAEAARWQAAAQRMDARAMAVSLSAQLLESWFDLGFQLKQRELIETQTETSEKLLALLKRRFLQGAGSALDALQQRQQLQSLQTTLAVSQAEIELRQNQVAVLLGQEPDEPLPALPEDLPEIEPLDPAQSFSASALALRPDLRSAFYLVQAADAQLAAALAQRLPGVRLSAALFDQGASITSLVDSLLWRVAGSVLQPIYDGGRIAAQIDEAEASLDVQLWQYRQVLLTSLQELSNAWISENLEATRIANLTQQQNIAERVYRLARQQYLRGTVDYLRVLNALQSLVELQQQLLRAQRQHLSFRIQFCRALGIGWIPDANQPGPP